MGPCLNEMQRQVTLHFISLKDTTSRLEQIEPIVTIVLRLVRLVRVESPLLRHEQVRVLDMLVKTNYATMLAA